MALTKPQGNMVMKLGTEQASTSGTAIDFTGIPVGTTMIVISLVGVSTDAVASLTLLIGSGSVDTGSTYTTSTGYFIAGGTTGLTYSAANSGMYISVGSLAADSHNTMAILVLEDPDNNTWSLFGNGSSSVYFSGNNGSKSLSGALDRVRVFGGGNTFDAGVINIAYF